MKVSRYTPSLLKSEALEAMFVQRHKLAQQLVEFIHDSTFTPAKHYTLLIGPRGIGKTHLISLVYHRVCQNPELSDHLRIAWLREEEWGIGSFLDFLLRVLHALQTEYKDAELSEKIESLYQLSEEGAEQVALTVLRGFIGNRTLLILMENLDEIFVGLGDGGQQQLRAFLQEEGCCTILATAQSLFNGIRLQTSPFYGFFRIRHLKDFTAADATKLLGRIADLEGNSELATFIRSTQGQSRIQAVHHLAGGNPRIYVVFSEFLTRQSLDQLIDPFMKMLDDLTPYYQARMGWLSPQQRKIIEFLCDRKYAVPVKEISQRCFITPQTASSQLKDLRDKGYVIADQIGRQSFYELREPLMRICLSVKQYRGEPIRLIVDFLRNWYPRRELEAMQASLTAQPAQNQVVGEYLQLALDDSYFTEADQRTQAYVEEIQTHTHQGNCDAGLKIAEKLIRHDPGVGHEQYAVCLWYLGRYQEALNHLNKAIEIKPNFLKALVDRGYILNQLSRHKDARANFQKALHITPDDSDHSAWNARGNALSGMGLYEEAIASFDKAIKLKPDHYQAWTNRGIALGNLGRTEDAIASFDKAIEIKPDLHQAWYNRGVDLANLGRTEEAIASFDQVLKLNPDDLSVQVKRAELLLQLNRWNEGYAALDQGLQHLMKANQTYPGDAKAAVLGVFRNTHDDQQWRSRIATLVDLFEKYHFLGVLGVGLAKSCDALITPMVSDAAAMAWQDAWVEVVGDRDEFQIALRLLNATIHYKQTPDDPRVFLELPVEERKLLQQILSK